ncbi:stalk domain-containing protein [Tepidibacter hydrothermalis]|uniref:Stalk domain-containing protein n=1 Tax=Tepidibacter hydrothermalis TaxID=3036126 RepID=A0ABY8EG76_9FIRM|nr:stalk domain-containing protein [Tepidibacter hydrothermalis]WFD09855.1 stalk domain-containing protein [Tepidibacter hydrothermalis]
MKIKNKAIATTLIGASLLTNMMPVFANEKPTTCIDIRKPILISEQGENPVPVLISNAPNKIINVNIDGKIVPFPDQKPMLIKDESRTIVPVRFITEYLGGTASWDADSKTATIELDGKKVELPVNKKHANVDGKQVKLDSSAKLISNRTFVPLRFVCETFGYDVSWDKESNTVILQKNNSITLSENPTTGYVWHYSIENESIVKVVSDNYQQDKIDSELSNDENIAICGVGGKHTWELEGLKEGTTIIKFESYRPGEEKDKTTNTKEYTITVDSDLKVSIKEKEDMYTGGSKYFDEELGLYKMFGNVTKIENDTILVDGEGMYDQIRFNINEDTEIVDLDGMKLSKDDITDESKIVVYHDQKMTRSLPPIANAQKIVVANLNVKDGKITQITDVKNGKMFLIGNMNDGINFNISDETVIVNELGQKLTVDALAKGVEVEVYYGNMMTMSLPPITSAKKVVVKSINVKEGNISQITNVKNGMMFLVGNMNDGINFNITDKTSIVDEAGQNLSVDDLAKGTEVEVYYGNMMTASLPPITNATKVVVKGVYAMTGDVKSLEGNYMLVEGNGLYNQIKFNITDETKIVDKEGKELSKSDIKEGSKVVAYHGGAMTRSLPPITNATKIIVE